MEEFFGISIIVIGLGVLGYFIYGKLKKKWAKKAAEDDDEAYE